MQTMNIGRSTRQEFNISTLNTIAIVFSSRFNSPFIVSWLCYPTQQCNRMRFSWSSSQISWRHIFVAKCLLHSKRFTRWRSELLVGIFFLLILQILLHGKQVTH